MLVRTVLELTQKLYRRKVAQENQYCTDFNPLKVFNRYPVNILRFLVNKYSPVLNLMVSKYVTGTWNSDETDDFELKNGTIIEFESLQPTEFLDVLEGSLLEEPLYAFGQTCKLSLLPHFSLNIIINSFDLARYFVFFKQGR